MWPLVLVAIAIVICCVMIAANEIARSHRSQQDNGQASGSTGAAEG